MSLNVGFNYVGSSRGMPGVLPAGRQARGLFLGSEVVHGPPLPHLPTSPPVATPAAQRTNTCERDSLINPTFDLLVTC